MARTSDSIMTVRQDEVRDMLLQGKSTASIIKDIGSKYRIARSTIERDITIVYKQLRIYIEKSREDIIAEHIAKYDRIFEQCMDIYDYRDAMKALRQKEELLKYHRNEPIIAIQNNTMNMENVSDSAIIDAIEKLRNLKYGT